MKTFAKQNLKVLGFEEELKRIENKQCPFCGSSKTSKKDFRDELSWKEFKISALCQKCQDDIFDE